MHVSLTPELETRVKAKVKSGLYNNASEVVREALRFMDTLKRLWTACLKISRDNHHECVHTPYSSRLLLGTT